MKDIDYRRYFVMVSNSGNHTGFNREWRLLFTTYTLKEARAMLVDYALNYISDDFVCRSRRPFDTSTKRYVVTNSMLRNGGFEYDGRSYAVVCSVDVDDFFNGGSNGYLPSFISETED